VESRKNIGLILVLIFLPEIYPFISTPTLILMKSRN
jgi:hypothetical protein